MSHVVKVVVLFDQIIDFVSMHVAVRDGKLDKSQEFVPGRCREATIGAFPRIVGVSLAFCLVNVKVAADVKQVVGWNALGGNHNCICRGYIMQVQFTPIVLLVIGAQKVGVFFEHGHVNVIHLVQGCVDDDVVAERHIFPPNHFGINVCVPALLVHNRNNACRIDVVGIFAWLVVFNPAIVQHALFLGGLNGWKGSHPSLEHHSVPIFVFQTLAVKFHGNVIVCGQHQVSHGRKEIGEKGGFEVGGCGFVCLVLNCFIFLFCFVKCFVGWMDGGVAHLFFLRPMYIMRHSRRHRSRSRSRSQRAARTMRRAAARGASAAASAAKSAARSAAKAASRAASASRGASAARAANAARGAQKAASRAAQAAAAAGAAASRAAAAGRA